MAVQIADNAKTQRYSHLQHDGNAAGRARASRRACCRELCRTLRGRKRSSCAATRQPRSLLQADGIACGAATEEDWRTEYLAPILAIRIVAGIDEAIAHINEFGSNTPTPSSPRTTATRCASCAKSIRHR